MIRYDNDEEMTPEEFEQERKDFIAFMESAELDSALRDTAAWGHNKSVAKMMNAYSDVLVTSRKNGFSFDEILESIEAAGRPLYVDIIDKLIPMTGVARKGIKGAKEGHVAQSFEEVLAVLTSTLPELSKPLTLSYAWVLTSAYGLSAVRTVDVQKLFALVTQHGISEAGRAVLSVGIEQAGGLLTVEIDPIFARFMA